MGKLRDFDFKGIITEKHPQSHLILVVDSDMKRIPFIKEYNTETKEAILYKVIQSGKSRSRVEVDKNGNIVFEKKVLEGSKLMMRVYE